MKKLTESKKKELIENLAGIKAGTLRSNTVGEKVYLMGDFGIKSIYPIQYMEAILKRVERGEIKQEEIEKEVSRIKSEGEEREAYLEEYLKEFTPSFQEVVVHVGKPYYFVEFVGEKKEFCKISNGKDIVEVLTVKLKQIEK